MLDEEREAKVDRLLGGGPSNRAFFTETKRLSSAAPTPPWKVQDLFSGSDDKEVGDQVLGYFGNISRSEVPGTSGYSENPWWSARIHAGSNSKLFKESKKTDSLVDGDPLPHLIQRFPKAFAGPVMKI